MKKISLNLSGMAKVMSEMELKKVMGGGGEYVATGTSGWVDSGFVTVCCSGGSTYQTTPGGTPENSGVNQCPPPQVPVTCPTDSIPPPPPPVLPTDSIPTK